MNTKTFITISAIIFSNQPSRAFATSDREVLNLIYDSCSGGKWFREKNWKDNNKSICEWDGISCTQSTDADNDFTEAVESIDLSDNNLEGQLPIALIFEMQKLKVLKLSRNSLEWDKIKSDDHSPTSSVITYIDLSDTGLDSLEPIFADVMMPHLTDLYLGMNDIYGNFPPSLFQFSSSLERLKMESNDLNGKIPQNINNFSHLTYLNLSDNYLEGEIPETITRLNKLKFLLLRGNKLSGPIPSDIENMLFLEHVDLSRQAGLDSIGGINGKLPAFSAMTQLKRLDLSFNSITGRIASDFLSSVDPNRFDYAFLMSNLITGMLPKKPFLRLPQGSIYVQDNKITSISAKICRPDRDGAIGAFGCDAVLCHPFSYNEAGMQEEIGKKCLYCDTTEYFGSTSCPITPLADNTEHYSPSPTPSNSNNSPGQDLNESDILRSLYQECGGEDWSHDDGWMSSDSICSWYGVTCVDNGSESVEFLMLSDNNVKGNIPTSLFNLPNLRSLSLSGNDDIVFHFNGIENANKLTTLDLQGIDLSSIDGIENAPDLHDLDLSDNQLMGSIPFNLFSLSTLRELKLDGNSLDGILPNDFSKLPKLKDLSASNNFFTGELPYAFTQLPIQNLRLRSNNLSGSLENVLGSMTSLITVDLSRQIDKGRIGFTGKIPALESLHELRRLDISHNNLSGTIPDTFLINVIAGNFEFADLASNSLTGAIPERLKDLHDIYLQDNMISSISKELCSGSNILEQFGCDAILCSPGTYNILGRRQSYDTVCEPCSTAYYYGAISCPPRTHSLVPSYPEPPSEPTKKMTERDILERFYNKCGGQEWHDKSGWMDENEEICNWFGVQCNIDKNVESLTLRSNNLLGVPPSEIFDLPALAALTLESNAIDFDFKGIENAKKLNTLDLSHTNVESIIGIQKSTSITNLYLASTNLRGQISPELFELRGLVHLSIEFNDLSGSIPPQLGNLEDLEYLAIHDNRLSGHLPSAVGQLKRLQFLLARHNDFSGSIPSDLTTLTNLWFIDLSDQKSFGGVGFTGNLPSFNDFSDLRRLDLNSNSLAGEIPSDLLKSINPDTFEYVDLSSNKLTGTVPDFVALLPIDGIFLSNNEIVSINGNLCDERRGFLAKKYGCDSILCPPQTFNNIGKQDKDTNPCVECKSSIPFFGSTSCDDSTSTETSSPSEQNRTPLGLSSTEKNILEKLYNTCGGHNWERSDNWMDDNVSICKWFGIRCTDSATTESVQFILLSSNNLVGIPPQDLFLLPNLETLVLDNNAISFEFSSIDNALKLSTLDLSSTEVRSIEGISAAPNLVELQLTNNNIEGTIPNELFQMSKIEQLALDFNQFSGSIPNVIGNLYYLRLFSCAFNRLKGPLPVALGNLKQLVTLRLQSNNFSGMIPDELGDMTNLAFLDLSNQRSNDKPGFTGTIPSFTKLHDIHRIDLSSNSLTGTIPSTFLENSNSKYVNVIDLSGNKLVGSVPIELNRFDSIRLQGNMISDFDSSFCSNSFGCNGFLCEPRSFNTLGRQESLGSVCVDCASAKYYGATSCDDFTHTPKPSPTNKLKTLYPSKNTDSNLNYPQKNSPASSPELSGFSSEVSLSDRDILVLFYNRCGGEHWLYRDNWMSSESICTWNGIICADGKEKVKQIALGANNVKGIPPVELYQLEYLESLVLYSNPLQDFSFERISGAKNLKELVLDATGIESIKGIERAPTLETVKLRFNKIRGNIGDITSLVSLQFLSVSNNYLTGTVPSDFDNLKNLKALLLGDNHLEGDLRSIRFPDSLRIIDFSQNDLTGSIPSNFLTEFRNSAELFVDLSGNAMSGTVPSTLARFDQLSLFLRDNIFSDIDSEICSKDSWNGGDIGKYGCKGLMCPKGKSAPEGRQTDVNKCTSCKHSKHLGSSICHSTDHSSGHYAFKLGFLWILCFFISLLLIQ